MSLRPLALTGIALDDLERVPLFDSFPIWVCEGCGFLRDGCDVGAALGEGLGTLTTGVPIDSRQRCSECGRPPKRKG